MGSPRRAEAAHRGRLPGDRRGSGAGRLTLMRSFSFCHLSASSSSSMTLSCSCSFCRDSSVCRGGPGGRRRQGAVGEVGSGPAQGANSTGSLLTHPVLRSANPHPVPAKDPETRSKNPGLWGRASQPCLHRAKLLQGPPPKVSRREAQSPLLPVGLGPLGEGGELRGGGDPAQSRERPGLSRRHMLRA